MLSKKLNNPISSITDVIVWGNHSQTQYPDTHQVKVSGEPISAEHFEYLNGEFLSLVQKRGSAIIDVCGKSSSSSAANAICDHMHEWWFGTKHSSASMAVTSDGN